MDAHHCFQIAAFNSYWFMLIEDGEREAKCVETACEMFGAMWTANVEEVELFDKAITILYGSSWRCSVPWTSLFSTKKCGQNSRPFHFGP